MLQRAEADELLALEVLLAARDPHAVPWRLEFRALEPNLYDGAAGVGLFAAPFTYDAASHGIVLKAAFAKNGADDGAGHEPGDGERHHRRVPEQAADADAAQVAHDPPTPRSTPPPRAQPPDSSN